MLNIDDVRPLSDFQQNASEHIERLKQSGQPEVLTVNGEAEVVVQSAEAYQKLLDDVEELRTIQILRQSLEEAKRGEGRPARQVLREIAEKHAIELPE